MSETPKEALHTWLARRAAGPALAWLDETCSAVQSQGVGRPLYLAFGMAPRRFGRQPLGLSLDELAAADAARHRWQPTSWTTEQCARTLLTLSVPAPSGDALRASLDPLFADGDLGELVALYQALPLLPDPPAHRARCAEGVRSNMKAVFEAVALRNPYPAEQLEDPAWNQLVLKALFVESPLWQVIGVDERSNATLARMLVDYARERWSAKRPVSPELWRAVGPVADEPLFEDLARVLETGSEAERMAVALSSLHNERAASLHAKYASIFDRVRSKPPSWRDIASGKVS